MYISMEMLRLPHVVYWDFFFCSHRAVFEAESFYIDSLYNFISGVPELCQWKSCSRNVHAVKSSVK